MENINKKECINFYFYLQDCLLEIGSAYSILNRITLDNTPASENAAARICKSLFTLTVLNVCRIGDAIESNQFIIKNFHNSREKLNEFKRKYYTRDVITYRNIYLAHSRDKSERVIPDIEKIISLTESIIGYNEHNKEGVNLPQAFLNYILSFDKESSNYNGLNHIITESLKSDIKKRFEMNDNEFNRYAGIYEENSSIRAS